MAAFLVPDGLAFYAVAAAACALNLAAIGAVARGYVRSTPLFHTLVLLLSWALYQCAFRVFTDREATNVAASPWAPPCGFCPRSLGFDPGENSRICTGFIGSVERWMLLPWQFLPWSGGGRGNGSASAAAEERAPHMTAEAFVWWPTFAGCIIGFAVGAFADGVRRMMRWMGLRVRRRFRRWAYRARA
jgi:hypothetical protein